MNLPVVEQNLSFLRQGADLVGARLAPIPPIQALDPGTQRERRVVRLEWRGAQRGTGRRVPHPSNISRRSTGFLERPLLVRLRRGDGQIQHQRPGEVYGRRSERQQFVVVLQKVEVLALRLLDLDT